MIVICLRRFFIFVDNLYKNRVRLNSSMNYRISASMSCANPVCILQDFEQLEASIVDTYHFDICDGLFAPTFLLNFSLIKALRPISSKRFDVHLYCHYPSRYLEEIMRAGVDVVTVQIESEGDHYLDVIEQIQSVGLQAGVGILPTSSIPVDFEEVLKSVNHVVANTVGPAYAGQPFNPNGLENIKKIREISNRLEREIEIAVDGGVSVERLPEFLNAGSNHFICGTSSLFKPDNDLVGHAAEFKKALDLALDRAD